jgi:acyl-CoA dehydrogenase
LKTARDPIKAAQWIGAEVAGPHADAVDRDARFPHEAIAALREEGMLGALVPEDLGGGGCSLTDIARACEMLARHCASTAMIFAMHQIEIACLVRHGLPAPYFRAYLAEVADRELLVASATSEASVGGDLRTSVCAVEREGDTFRVTKQAPVISYGLEADDILLTARRHPGAAAGSQVLVLARKADTVLTQTGGWDTLGMRGTRSLSFTLTSGGSVEQIVPVPFADISSQTMLPVSHSLWASLWLGVATDAVARARKYVRINARRTPGTVPPNALRLAEVVTELETMRATVYGLQADYERHLDDDETLSGLGFAIRMNNLKVAASRMAPEIVGRALGVCGISGYRCDSPYALGRHLRDTYGAGLMIGNDRLWAANAAMLLVHKED